MDITEEQLSNQLNTPTSSTSSAYSMKSPTQKCQQKIIKDVEKSLNSEITKPDNLSITNAAQATTPLTPPPSVTQDQFLNQIENKLDISHSKLIVPQHPQPHSSNNKDNKDLHENNGEILLKHKSKVNENLKQSNSLKTVEQTKSLLLPDIQNSIKNKESELKSTDLNEEIDDDENEFPKSLEDLLVKQWSLGTNLIAEQSQNFDGIIRFK